MDEVGVDRTAEPDQFQILAIKGAIHDGPAVGHFGDLAVDLAAMCQVPWPTRRTGFCWDVNQPIRFFQKRDVEFGCFFAGPGHFRFEIPSYEPRLSNLKRLEMGFKKRTRILRRLGRLAQRVAMVFGKLEWSSVCS